VRKPFFSVIIPTYNRKHYVKIAIESVLRQDFDDYELIVVDDGSSDGTEVYLKQVGFGPRCRYLYQANKGPSAARNSGIRQAQGEYICFLDSDDRFVHYKLSVAHEYIQQYPDYRIFHTEELWYRDGAYLAQKDCHTKPEGFCFEQALTICCVSLSTAVVHRSVFDTVGLFDEAFYSCEDYDFWLRALQSFPIKLIPQYLTIKDGGRKDQQSQKYFGMDRFRVAAIQKVLPTLDAELKKKALGEIINKGSIYAQGALKRGKHEDAEYYQTMVSQAKEDLCSLIQRK
jgi:glycosyltransferase involved in cell wall biosynthesis